MRWCLGTTVALALACSQRVEPPVSPPAPGPTWHGSVRGLAQTHCVSCHSSNGVAPFSLDDWASAAPHAAALVDAVETHRMPPHAPAAGCRELLSPDVLAPEDVALLVAWRAAGFPEGTASEYQGPRVLPFELPRTVGEPSLVLTAAHDFTPPLGPDVSNEEEVTGAFAVDTWVVASELRPSALAVVHHANAFIAAGPGQVPMPSSVLGAYAPGYGPLVMPQGSALFVPAGSTVRLFVHYSVSTFSGAVVPADRPQLRLWALPAGTRPTQRARIDAVSQSELVIPALAAEVSITGETPLQPGTIAGVFPHMHLLGTGFRSSVLHADGGTSCLIELPDYDFFHQSLVLFSPGNEVTIGPGDVHRMSCRYDNSPGHQPLVGGVVKSSVEVRWGDASTDEMCTDGLLRLEPL